MTARASRLHFHCPTRPVASSLLALIAILLAGLATFTADPVAGQAAPTEPTAATETTSENEGPAPTPRQVGTMSDLMVKLLYPASDAIFYIETRTPTNDEEWTRLQGQALIVGEAANLLMSPIHAWDQDQWMRDAQLMLDVGEAAYEAALEKDVPALVELNEALYQSCLTCHLHYRPDYGK